MKEDGYNSHEKNFETVNKDNNLLKLAKSNQTAITHCKHLDMIDTQFMRYMYTLKKHNSVN